VADAPLEEEVKEPRQDSVQLGLDERVEESGAAEMDVSWEEDALFGGMEEVPVEEGLPDGGMETELLGMIYKAMEVVQTESSRKVLGGGGGKGVDIAEVYSPPRITKQATKMGLTPGLAMDLNTGWDFRLERHKEACRRYVAEVKPRLVVGSPMCKMFSQLQNLSKHRRGAGWEESYVEAEEHIKFVVEIYRMQVEGGRWFLHEHPAGASSWDLEVIKRLEKEAGVEISVADQCQYGLRTWGRNRRVKDVAARKRTKFMTNSEEIAAELRRRCRGEHEHGHLTGKRAQEAAIYPEGLCKAICRGLLKEKHNGMMKVKPLMSIRHTDSVGQGKNTVSHEEINEYTHAWDDVTGGILEPG
jgi:hypothetical protein